MGSCSAPPREDFLGSTGSDVKTCCGTRILVWKCSPQYWWGFAPILRDLIFGGSLVLGLPAPSLLGLHPCPTATGGPLGLGVPGLPARGLSQRSSGSSGSSSWAEAMGTVSPHPRGCHRLDSVPSAGPRFSHQGR